MGATNPENADEGTIRKEFLNKSSYGWFAKCKYWNSYFFEKMKYVFS